MTPILLTIFGCALGALLSIPTDAFLYGRRLDMTRRWWIAFFVACLVTGLLTPKTAVIHDFVYGLLAIFLAHQAANLYVLISARRSTALVMRAPPRADSHNRSEIEQENDCE